MLLKARTSKLSLESPCTPRRGLTAPGCAGGYRIWEMKPAGDAYWLLAVTAWWAFAGEGPPGPSASSGQSTPRDSKTAVTPNSIQAVVFGRIRSLTMNPSQNWSNATNLHGSVAAYFNLSPGILKFNRRHKVAVPAPAISIPTVVAPSPWCYTAPEEASNLSFRPRSTLPFRMPPDAAPEDKGTLPC